MWWVRQSLRHASPVFIKFHSDMWLGIFAAVLLFPLQKLSKLDLIGGASEDYVYTFTLFGFCFLAGAVGNTVIGGAMTLFNELIKTLVAAGQRLLDSEDEKGGDGNPPRETDHWEI